jgi:hypothetical protein
LRLEVWLDDEFASQRFVAEEVGEAPDGRKAIIRKDVHGNDDISKSLAKATEEMESHCQPVLAPQSSRPKRLMDLRIEKVKSLTRGEAD